MHHPEKGFVHWRLTLGGTAVLTGWWHEADHLHFTLPPFVCISNLLHHPQWIFCMTISKWLCPRNELIFKFQLLCGSDTIETILFCRFNLTWLILSKFSMNCIFLYLSVNKYTKEQDFWCPIPAAYKITTLTMATVALNDLEDSLHMRVRPSGGGFPGSACMYSSHDTGSVMGGSSEGLLADYR